MTDIEMFKAFCDEYNLHYNFDTIGKGNVFMHMVTHEAFIVFKYSGSFIKDHE